MILNVTEEQKKVIESQGYMVVEFIQEMALKCVEKLREFNFSLIEKWEPVAWYLDECGIEFDY